MSEIEDLIRGAVNFSGSSAGTGYLRFRCPLCNDYKDRAGFKFEGNLIIFKCFNCSEGIVQDTSEPRLRKKFKNLLISLGVDESELVKTSGAAYIERVKQLRDGIVETPKEEIKKPSWPSKIELPEGVVDINENDIWGQVATEYLTGRGLRSDISQFKVGTSGKYEGMLCIPSYARGNLIFMQARNMDHSLKTRYLSVSTPRQAAFHNMDELFKYSKTPIFVTEGAIDAISIGPAVALIGGTMTTDHEFYLSEAAKTRKVCFVIDKNQVGLKLASKILEFGWYVTVMPDGFSDANDVRKKRGHIWLANWLMNNMKTGMDGKLMVKLACK